MMQSVPPPSGITPVWSFWHQPDGKRPQVVDMCIKSWSEQLDAQKFRITVLSNDTLSAYPIIKPDCFDQLPPPQQSDVIRLSLLYYFGGLWMDASVLLTQPLSEGVLREDLPVSGLMLPDHTHLESWLLYAPRARSPEVLRWLETMNAMFDGKIPITQSCTDNAKYFIVYEAFCHLRRTDDRFRRIYEQSVVRRSTLRSEWNFYAFIVPNPFRRYPPIVKFSRACRWKYKWRLAVWSFALVLLLFTVLVVVALRSRWKQPRKI
jgi:hypothetical protein